MPLPSQPHVSLNLNMASLFSQPQISDNLDLEDMMLPLSQPHISYNAVGLEDMIPPSSQPHISYNAVGWEDMMLLPSQSCNTMCWKDTMPPPSQPCTIHNVVDLDDLPPPSSLSVRQSLQRSFLTASQTRMMKNFQLGHSSRPG